MKPLYDNGSAAVFIPQGDTNSIRSSSFGRDLPRAIMVRRYVPAVRKGDKRIILVDGEFAGAINRVPPRRDPLEPASAARRRPRR